MYPSNLIIYEGRNLFDTKKALPQKRLKNETYYLTKCNKFLLKCSINNQALVHVHLSTIQAQLELSTQRKGKVPKLPKIKQREGIKYKPKSQTFIILSAAEGIKKNS